MMVCHIWDSLKLNINKKQNSKQQLKVPSQLLTLGNSRDRSGRSYLTQLKACLGLVGLWVFFVFAVVFHKKKEKNT